ncbi:Amino acid transporter [Methylocella tundrae]|uniref:Amino acid transporter n=1 Tax=Methylocella tundrae TaxID=227605 RepID=A0A8B6M573_METTU|nr:APC family permease [Methylocella tundrae]VTZ49994.1 Amino acid transporter [Methylocella tundrae]
MKLQTTSKKAGLRRSVGFLGVLGQSVAGVAPTTTPTINVALVFAAAGSGTWLAFLVATLAILLVALNLAPLARTFAGAGSLSEFVGHGLGPVGRLITAWILLLVYLALSVATLAGCTAYVSTLFEAARISLPLIFWVALVGSVAVLFALRDIRLSTVLMLALEIISILLVVVLGITILVRLGVAVDLAQLRLTGLRGSGMSSALLIGVLSFVGFEAAATLGDEAEQPLRDIPRVLILTPVLAGVFFVFSAYVIVLGFNHYGIAVATSDAPLDDLARALDRPGLGAVVSIGTAISLFACATATMVASSRIAFALAQQNAIPAALARLGRRSAPTRAVALSAFLIMATALALATFAKPLDIYDWLGTFGTFGCVIAYGLACVSTPIFLRRAGQLRVGHVVLSAAALIVLGYVLLGSVYPIPAAPLNVLPLLFVGLLATGTLYSLRRQTVISRA